MRSVLLALALVLICGGGAHAACTCQCANGRMQSLCQSPIDPPQVCPPTICPIVAPSVVPIKPLPLPRTGTAQCRQEQVCNASGNCQWQEVCR